MTRFRVDLEYDGAPYAGWQLQPNARTVQAEVEDALQRLLGHHARVYAAGRTDTGVHARQQVVVFDTDVSRTEKAVRDGLNAHLPSEVACVAARVVPDDFDPRRAPHTKTYRYAWLVRPSRSPLRRGRCWHVRRPLDVEAMASAVAHVAGTHDFSSFRAEGCTANHPVRTVEGASVRAVEDEVWLDIHGTGFLRHMVRILAGTLQVVGTGRKPPEWLAEVVAARRREAAGSTAPAEGLTLMRIAYDPEP
ncbi:MAG: tRNA pseudouridine(38-40) synthase TruA [Alphaproteobacteria bacterium]|nr:tRNA pseudouridine(38-40) synthase TruA [Alphaproteobacteria bacterium]